MDNARAKLAQLMADGEGFSGFKWPEHEQDFDMRIARDGRWYYQGGEIQRQALVKLFATILQRDENGDYWLATPAEKGRVEVEDAPFTIISMRLENPGKDQVLFMTTNLGYEISVGEGHDVFLIKDAETGEPAPYIHIRDNLNALISRSVFYELAEFAIEADNGGDLGIWSSGRFYQLD
ncbi:MAG: DUF1285 domain-containing protein [Alphaproteobacteria bacterium]|nr:DUF1285 domain-containing protein [Alphaproteobacteria bacterium]